MTLAFEYIAALFVAGLLVLFAWRWLTARLEYRAALNLTMSAAGADFYETANSILKTPHDVPGRVLDLISFMSQIANTDGSERGFLNALRMQNIGGRNAGSANADLSAEVSQMRPELRELLDKLSRAWFLLMMSKSTRYSRLLTLEIMKLVGQQHKTELSTRDGVKAASQMMTCAA